MVCRDCIYKLDLCYEFKIKSIASQHYLSGLYDTHLVRGSMHCSLLVFISELFKHDVLGNDFIESKDVLQNQEFQCLGIGDDISDQSAIQELEHFVDDTHLQADCGDISKMIQYHDTDVSTTTSTQQTMNSTSTFVADFRISKSGN